jgi:hypothetical protein
VSVVVAVESLGEAKIGDLGFQFGVQKDVGSLHIPVNEGRVAPFV